MSYFGKYNGSFFGSWWGARIIIFVKGKATSMIALLNKSVSFVKNAYGVAANESVLKVVTSAKSVIASNSAVLINASKAEEKINITSSNAKISLAQSNLKASGGHTSSKAANDARNATESTSALSNDKNASKGESSNV